MRLPVPGGLVDEWSRLGLDGRVRIQAEWGEKVAFQLGVLDLDRAAFRYEPSWRNGGNDQLPADKFSEGPERASRLFAKAITRAGWLRPRLDPAAVASLVALRADRRRVEFTFDTNAMNEGVGHWLLDHFADRCDLVVTPVSLRELQDQFGPSRFSRTLPHEESKKKDRGDSLGARQLYLAGHRFRERPGYDRVLWRELEMDDAALLLSNGQAGGDKSSAADTMLLRAVRRSIQDRVNGLERLFVVGDTALARRATTELPPKSVVAAQVPDLVDGRVYFPSAWWPVPDLGSRLPRHPSRLIWELLAIADSVRLTGTGGRTWRFTAFGNPMWPSDYTDPWVEVVVEPPIQPATPTPEPTATPASEPDHAPLEVRQSPPESPANAPTQLGQPNEAVVATPDTPPTASGAPGREPWGAPPPPPELLDANLRLTTAMLLDALAAIAVHGQAGPVRLPAVFATNTEVKSHLRQLLAVSRLAVVSRDGATAEPGELVPSLRTAWAANDLDALFDILRGWNALRELATELSAPTRPTVSIERTRGVAAHLGQGVFIDHRWYPGGMRPPPALMRDVLRAAVPAAPLPPALPIKTVLVEVFLKQLGVAPARVVAAWERLVSAGVFEGFEFRSGGSDSGSAVKVASLTGEGWTLREVALDQIGGYRDVLWRGSDP